MVRIAPPSPRPRPSIRSGFQGAYVKIFKGSASLATAKWQTILLVKVCVAVTDSGTKGRFSSAALLAATCMTSPQEEAYPCQHRSPPMHSPNSWHQTRNLLRVAVSLLALAVHRPLLSVLQTRDTTTSTLHDSRPRSALLSAILDKFRSGDPKHCDENLKMFDVCGSGCITTCVLGLATTEKAHTRIFQHREMLVSTVRFRRLLQGRLRRHLHGTIHDSARRRFARRFEEVVLPVIDVCALRTVRQTDSASLSSAVCLAGNESLELWAA